MTTCEQEIVNQFHRLYYDRGNHGSTWHYTHWNGIKVLKCPLDLWVYQEILYETRPEVVVETGTCNGGSAYFMASMMDLLGFPPKFRVITVDSVVRPNMPKHPRIQYLTGSSVSPEMHGIISQSTQGKRTMVVLDSDHHKDHVVREIRLYAPLVTPGCYLIVEDSNLNGHPTGLDFGPGPMEAIQETVAQDPLFVNDPSRERHLMTLNPMGYWRRL